MKKFFALFVTLMVLFCTAGLAEETPDTDVISNLTIVDPAVELEDEVYRVICEVVDTALVTHENWGKYSSSEGRVRLVEFKNDRYVAHIIRFTEHNREPQYEILFLKEEEVLPPLFWDSCAEPTLETMLVTTFYRDEEGRDTRTTETIMYRFSLPTGAMNANI